MPDGSLHPNDILFFSFWYVLILYLDNSKILPTIQKVFGC